MVTENIDLDLKQRKKSQEIILTKKKSVMS